jgi:glyoxylase-like metal-dependent hydrolase (beta-lactamase superfamily II)
MRITHVIDTHVHADHRSGGAALAKRTGASYCLHESADVAKPFFPLHDNQEIELGNTQVKVLHTTRTLARERLFTRHRSETGSEPWFVLTGDTLFVGAVGRPDLPGRARQNAGDLYVSLHEKLLTLLETLRSTRAISLDPSVVPG